MAAKHFLGMLSVNTSLVHLDIGQNCIGDKNERALECAVRHRFGFELKLSPFKDLVLV